MTVRKTILILITLGTNVALPVVHAQVLDVDGDAFVGPHEALALVKDWRGAAVSRIPHDHLGETWEGVDGGDTLTINGTTPAALLTVVNNHTTGFAASFVNTQGKAVYCQSGTDSRPDLVLGVNSGVDDNGTIASHLDDFDSDLVLVSADHAEIHLDNDNNPSANSRFAIRNGQNAVVWSVYESGNVTSKGPISSSLSLTRIDHPDDPKEKDILYAGLSSSEARLVHEGTVRLDDDGEAWVPVPDYFEKMSTDVCYQLTAVGVPSPNLHVAEEISGGRFRIGGGASGGKVCWRISGIRTDAVAKAVGSLGVTPKEPEPELP